MDRVLGVAAQHGLMVIEDAAQGVNATYQGRYLGTLGALGAYSFHETKNFIAVEGGALVINDESLVERAEILRHKGTNRAHFDRGEVDKYTWVDVGSSFLPSELVAAFLFAQLEEAERITAQRRSLYDRYMERLAPLEEKGDLRLPRTTAGAAHNAHLVYVTVPQREVRDRLLSFLQDQGILAIFHYVPLHTSPMGLRLGCREGELPVTEAMAGRVLRLPCYFELDEETQDVVIDAVFRFFGQRG
jgi:dTDP-4-amino-4,6-dideoxygalactose transaminase